MVKLLLKHGANVDAEDNSDSPLHLAIHAGHGELARLLMEAGADVQARNHAGNPPVQVAAFAGLPEVIKLLVEAGSPVNLQDQVGDTPLHDAALQGQVEAAQALIAAGADVHATNNAGKTPPGPCPAKRPRERGRSAPGSRWLAQQGGLLDAGDQAGPHARAR